MNTYFDALETLQELLANNASGRGCVAVYIDGLAATLRWGQCSENCTRFNGCIRSTANNLVEVDSQQYG